MMRAGERGRTTAVAAAMLALAAVLAWWLWPAPQSPGVAGTPAAGTAAPASIPVIIYLIDTLRADRLSLYGYDKPTSPRMEALAKESVVFEHAYATAPWTVPSLASIVTSTYACEHGVTSARTTPNRAFRTLAERVAELGYATAAYYENAFAGPLLDLDRGYQVSEDPGQRGVMDEKARAFVERVGAAPFLLYLHTVEPHDAFLTPGKFIQRLGHVSVDERETFRGRWLALRWMMNTDALNGRAPGTTDYTAEIGRVSDNLLGTKAVIDRLYDAAVAYADDELGQTVDALKATGAWDRALFIVLADHGEEFDEHGFWFHDQSVYEELIHVPLLVHLPGGEHGGTRIAERVSLLDVMPTVLDVIGHGNACEGCRGSSLLPLLRPEAGGEYRSAPVPAVRLNNAGYYKVLKELRGDVNVVVRDGDAKAIWNEEPGTTEIYDLAIDAAERADLHERQPEAAVRSARLAAQWLADCRALAKATGRPNGQVYDTTRDQLRAMGYFN